MLCAMKDNFIGSVGIWGQRHYRYLKENKPTVIFNSDGGSAVESQTLFPGYVLAAVIALALGVCITLLCARKKKNNTQSDKEETP